MYPLLILLLYFYFQISCLPLYLSHFWLNISSYLSYIKSLIFADTFLNFHACTHVSARARVHTHTHTHTHTQNLFYDFLHFYISIILALYRTVSIWSFYLILISDHTFWSLSFLLSFLLSLSDISCTYNLYNIFRSLISVHMFRYTSNCNVLLCSDS